MFSSFFNLASSSNQAFYLPPTSPTPHSVPNQASYSTNTKSPTLTNNDNFIWSGAQFADTTSQPSYNDSQLLSTYSKQPMPLLKNSYTPWMNGYMSEYDSAKYTSNTSSTINTNTATVKDHSAVTDEIRSQFSDLLHTVGNDSERSNIIDASPSFYEFVSEKSLPHQSSISNENNNLLHVLDSCGVIDYLYKSCSGQPYGGEKLGGVDSDFKNKTPVFNGKAILETTKSQTLHDSFEEIFLPPTTDIAHCFKEEPHIELSESSHSLHSFDDSDSGSDRMDGFIKIPPQELLSANDTTIKGTNRIKTKLCKRFVYGKCHKRDCNFLHAKPLTVHRDQIIFLGGIPSNVSRKALFYELKRNGVPVINLPMVIDRFTPRVALESKESAKRYIRKKMIKLFGKSVDVRPYKQSHEVYQIFLGGLIPETSVEDIRYGLQLHKCELINIPTINKGYSINVEVKSRDQQKRLLREKHICICGKLVEVKKITKRTKRKWNKLK